MYKFEFFISKIKQIINIKSFFDQNIYSILDIQIYIVKMFEHNTFYFFLNFKQFKKLKALSTILHI
jgi:hypothetical protein